MPAQRLVPRWYSTLALAVLLVVTISFVVMGATSQGAARWVGLASGAMVGAGFIAAGVSLVGRRRPVSVPATGQVAISSPRTITSLLLLAWALFFATSIAWVVLALTDFSAIETPGLVLIWVLSSLASVPDFVRLLTGRLHRWQLILNDETLTYRGYRTNVTVPWSDVRGAAVQRRGPAGVAINLRANQPDIVVPALAFLVPVEQVVQLVLDRRRQV